MKELPQTPQNGRGIGPEGYEKPPIPPVKVQLLAGLQMAAWAQNRKGEKGGGRGIL